MEVAPCPLIALMAAAVMSGQQQQRFVQAATPRKRRSSAVASTLTFALPRLAGESWPPPKCLEPRLLGIFTAAPQAVTRTSCCGASFERTARSSWSPFVARCIIEQRHGVAMEGGDEELERLVAQNPGARIVRPGDPMPAQPPRRHFSMNASPAQEQMAMVQHIV